MLRWWFVSLFLAVPSAWAVEGAIFIWERTDMNVRSYHVGRVGPGALWFRLHEFAPVEGVFTVTSDAKGTKYWLFRSDSNAGGKTEMYSFEPRKPKGLSIVHDHGFRALAPFTADQAVGWDGSSDQLYVISASGIQELTPAKLLPTLYDVTLVRLTATEIAVYGSQDPKAAVMKGTTVDYEVNIVTFDPRRINPPKVTWTKPAPRGVARSRPLISRYGIFYSSPSMLKPGFRVLRHVPVPGQSDHSWTIRSQIIVPQAEPLEPLGIEPGPGIDELTLFYRANEALNTLIIGSTPKVSTPAAKFFGVELLDGLTGGIIPTTNVGHSVVTRIAPQGVFHIGIAAAPAKPKVTLKSRLEATWKAARAKRVVVADDLPASLSSSAVVALLEQVPLDSDWMNALLVELSYEERAAFGIEKRSGAWSTIGLGKTFTVDDFLKKLHGTPSCGKVLASP